MIRTAALLIALAHPALALDDPLPNALARTAAEQSRIAAVVQPTTDFSQPEPYEALPAGAATTHRGSTADAFSQPSANMPFDRQMEFQLGNALFTKAWVPAPSSTKASDGLGPLFNARACQDCHIKDGRGHAPLSATDGTVSMILRLSLPANTGPADIADWIATKPDPTYGAQLQDHAAAGQRAEGRIDLFYNNIPVKLADGTTVTLRKPTFLIGDPAYDQPDPAMMISPRTAPQMIGLGLLEAIPTADILSAEDPLDANRDGISGRAARIPTATGPALGRFGLKGGTPSITTQSAAAFSGDMGLSTRLHPDPSGDCTTAQAACKTAPTGQEPTARDGFEVSDESLDLVTFYARNLAVPDRPLAADPTVLRGKQVFYETGCTGCHTPKHVTARLTGQPEQSFQLIWPYTDLLLHDMGEGLADHRPEGSATGSATGSEWKTPPLWGIGLTAQVTGVESYLHDGRARTLLEAVLWHGGEAAPARDRTIALPQADRNALIAFLDSL